MGLLMQWQGLKLGKPSSQNKFDLTITMRNHN